MSFLVCKPFLVQQLNLHNLKEKKTDDILEKLVHVNRITKVVKEISIEEGLLLVDWPDNF